MAFGIQKGALVLSAMALIGVLGFSIQQYWAATEGTIVPYDEARDRSAIIRIFDENAYWLHAQGAEYPTEVHRSFVEETLPQSLIPEEERTPHHVRFMVYRHAGQTIGFVAYRFESSTRGKLLFIAVDKQSRQHGVATKLMKYALKQMYEHGAQSIELVTRPSNITAQQLYKKTGFRETARDNEFVWFEQTV